MSFVALAPSSLGVRSGAVRRAFASFASFSFMAVSLSCWGLRYSHKLPLLRQHFSDRNVAAAYGMMVADNGSNWYISGAPDPHWLNSRPGRRAVAGQGLEFRGRQDEGN